MSQQVEVVLPVSAEPQQPRRRRLYELIIAGFEHLLSQQQGHACIDGRGAGYVVWVPRREQYQEVWGGGMRREEEGEEEDGSRPLVLYGGGYDGLFQGALEKALGYCDCLSPPLRWVRIPLELLPPPKPAPSSSPVGGRRAPPSAKDVDSAGRLSPSSRVSQASGQQQQQQQRGRKNKFGFRGVAPAPAGGWGAAEKRRGGGARRGEENASKKGKAGVFDEGRSDERRDGSVDVENGRGDGGDGAAGVDNGRRLREREVVDLWWLTDPPAPKVSAEASRLRVATESVEILRADAEEVPDVVCTIEVCQGRPYLPGRLQRYPNVATSSGPYRAVHSYRVLASGPQFSEQEPPPPGREGVGGAAAGTVGGSLFASPSPAAPSSGRGARSRERGGERLAWVSVTDVKPSHWYNVRHRFSWRIGGGASFGGVEEVVTATRHVHTEAFLPPVYPPRKPYAVLGCCRRQQQQGRHQQQHQHPYRRPSREAGGGRDNGGLSFHFRLRWGPGPRGTGRNDYLFVGQAGTPHGNEYVLQVSTLDLGSSTGKAGHNPGVTAGKRGSREAGSARKSKASSPMPGGDGPGSSHGFGGSSPNLRSTGTGITVGTGGEDAARGLQARTANSAAFRHNATWSSGVRHTAADSGGHDAAPFDDWLSGGDGGSKADSKDDGSDGDSRRRGWGAWKTVCRTRKTRETVELPRLAPSLRRGAPSAPQGLRYRVGARRADTIQRAAYSDVLEVPTALLRRLYEIEDISASRNPVLTSSTAQNALGGGPSAATWEGQEGGGLSKEEATNFLQAFQMSGDGDGFPARVAWELQSEFWAQEDVEEEAMSLTKETEARVKAEAESIQHTLEFPVNVGIIAGIIRQLDAPAGG